MKKVLIALAVIVVLVIGGVFLLFSNLDKLVETGIERAGTETLGTPVEVGRVELALTAGAASIYDFSIANPPGFSNADMVSFDELSVVINLQNTSSEQIHISSVVARNPHVRYESSDGVSNVDTVSARFENGEAEAVAESETSTVNLIIDSILIEDIDGTLQSGLLPEPVEVSLGDINLSGLEGSPDEMANQIMAPVLSQIGAVAAQALVQATTDLLGETVEQVGQQLDSAREQAQEAAQDLSDQADELLDNVDNLFNRD